MVDVAKYTQSLLAKDGIWMGQLPDALSYPETAADLFYEIEAESFWFRHRNRVLSSVLKNFPPPGDFFDVGGGNGVVAHYLQKAGFNSVLLEPGNGVYSAKKRGLKNIIHSDLEGAGFEDGTLPAVGLFDVVEHIEDDQGFLRAVHRKLSSQGKLYITVPTYSWLWSQEDVVSGHFRRYTKHSIGELLKQCGFEVLFSSYFFSLLVPPIFLLRSLPHKITAQKETQPKAIAAAHTSPPLLRAAVESCLSWEVLLLKQQIPIPLGSSCIVVAKAI